MTLVEANVIISESMEQIKSTNKTLVEKYVDKVGYILRRKDIKNLAKARRILTLQEETKEVVEALDVVKNIEKITFNTDWIKSSQWGFNPHSNIMIQVRGKIGVWAVRSERATASGCGYDKMSSSIATALNSVSLGRALAFHIKERHPTIYGIDDGYFSGGVGTDCFVKALGLIGFNVDFMGGKTYDGYVFTRKGAYEVECKKMS